MALRFPDALPRTLGALASLPLVAYGFANLATATRLGAVPSNGGAGYSYVLLYAAIAAALGALIGRLLRGMVAGAEACTVSTGAAFTVLCGAIVGAGFLGYASARDEASPFRPAVLVDKGRLDGVVAVDSTRPLVEARLLLADTLAADTMTWRARPTRFRVDSGALVIEDVANGRRVAIDVQGLRAIARVEAVPVQHALGRPENLAVMIVGDSAGHRAMFALLDTDFRLLRQERLRYDRAPAEISLAVRRDAKHGRDLLIVAPGRGAPRLYAVRP